MSILSLGVLLTIPAFLFAQEQITPDDETPPNASETAVSTSSPQNSGALAEHQTVDGGSGGASSSVSNAASSDTSSESSSKIEHSIFSSLFMAGKTQDKFVPLTPKKRLKVYADDLFSPFHFFMAGVSAGVTQAQNVPGSGGKARRDMDAGTRTITESPQ